MLVDFGMSRHGATFACYHVSVEIMPPDRADENTPLLAKSSNKVAPLHANSITPDLHVDAGI